MLSNSKVWNDGIQQRCCGLIWNEEKTKELAVCEEFR